MGRRKATVWFLIALICIGAVSLIAGLGRSDETEKSQLIAGGLIVLAAAIVGFFRVFRRGSPTDDHVEDLPARAFLPEGVTPKVLRERAAGRTSVQIDALAKTYAGKWLRYEGRVCDVSATTADRWRLLLGDSDGAVSVAAEFGRKDQKQLFALNRGDQVTVEGRIIGLNPEVTLQEAVIVQVG